MIISDTDFLSAFIKINKVDLLFKTLDINEIIIPTAVFQEIEKSHFYNKFLQLLESKENRIVIKKVEDTTPSKDFGDGELECIVLAEKTNSLLLMEDKAAGRLAENKGIVVMDIFTFLLYCKLNKLLSLEEIKQIINDLKEKDYYEFSEEIKNELLK